MKLKTGDTVKVIRGKDKGKQAKIEQVLAKENAVLLPEINMYKRHIKGRMQGQPSEIKPVRKPLAATSVVLICPKCNKQTRVGYLITNGKKERICRKCKKTI